MPFTIAYNARLHIIEVTVQQTVRISEVDEVIGEMARLALEHQCFACLTDYREAALLWSTLDIYDTPYRILNLLQQYQLPAHKLRRAVVVKGEAVDFRFYETVARNSRQNVRIFHERELAIAWLIEAT